MGEYPQGGHGAAIDINPAPLEGIVGDSTTTIPNQCVKCFRIVDTVLTKVIQVQRLHMNLICDFVAFSDTGNRKETIERQRTECERLNEEMRCLKKIMLERVLCSGSNGSSMVALPRSAEDISPFPNIGPYTSEERDLINELKHECSVELINENENNLDSVGCFNSENSWKKLQSFTSLADGKEKGDELSRVSETTRCDERNGAGSIFFVDTDAVVLSDVPVIKIENSQDDETVTTLEDSVTGISQMQEMNAEEDPNSWFSEDTKDFLRSEEPIVEANDQTKVYKFATRTECLPVPHQLSDDECDWSKDYETGELQGISEATVKKEICEESNSSTECEVPVFHDELPSIDKSLRSLHCGICGLNFSQRKHLIQHIRSHNREESLTSNPYEETSNAPKSFVKHTVEKRSYACNVCARKFLRNGALARHMRIHNGEKPYACELCSKRCNQKSNLAKHMLTHNGEKPYACEICGRKFVQRSDLTKHTRIHSGEKPYECERCGRKFSQRWNLINHLRIHNGEKPHECEVCARKFRQRSDLTVHMRIHSGEKPYECKVCARKFRRRSDLPTHMRIHTGEKPYECKVCAKRFRFKSGLVCHLFTHEDGKSYECEVCSRRFREGGEQMGNGEGSVKCEVCAGNLTEREGLAEHIRVQWQKTMLLRGLRTKV